MKKALIIANMAGFASFLINDIDILQHMGYEITFAANTEELPWEDTRKKLLDRNVNIINIDFDTKSPISKRNIKAYKKVKKILKENFFELIHCHTPIVGFLTRWAARRERKRETTVIYTTHGFSFTEESSKKSWLIYFNIEKLLSRYCDAIITINKEDYNNAKKMFCKNVFYINGVGVDTKKFKDIDINITEYRKSFGVDSKKIMILSVGELSERKNHKIIIDAIALLKNKEDYVYVICGNGVDGGTADYLKRVANEKKVDLKLLGFRFDIPELMACSDFGAIPSIREGLGLAGIQSLASGKPLIATKVQGIKDYVINSKTGYLASPYNVKEFANNIIKLSDVNERKKMINECKKMADEFDISISKSQMKKIYEELLENNL